MRILLSHPSVAPFVQQAARAFDEVGALDRFITSLRHDPQSRRQQVVTSLARLVRFDLERQLARRKVTELPADRVESLPWGELLRLLVGKLDRSGRLTDLVWSRTEPRFDRAVARRVQRDHTAVYGFEYASLATFNRARELGVRTIYDVPAPEPLFVRRIIDREAEAFPVLRTRYHAHTAERERARIERRRAEWNHADVVIAASTFTRESFKSAGLDVSKVRIVPYGSPPPVSEAEAAHGGSISGRLELLWAGTFSVRKGAHYLLDAWRRQKLDRVARLRVFGAITLPRELLEPLPAGIELGGSIPRVELMPHYQTSDALIFPTLCDGFGMVVTEAWSRGLPVLTTPCAGAADLLKPNINGRLFPAADSQALADAIVHAAETRESLRTMRIAARATAAAWQWSDYRTALRAAVMGKSTAPQP